MKLKAIETRYKGCRFRSRLEARWAVFFDALKIPWEYEKEGFNLGGICYLPDFWLPRQQCWIEVKGEWPPSEQDQQKAERLAAASGKPVYMCVGEIIPWEWPSHNGPTIIGWRKRSEIRVAGWVGWNEPIDPDKIIAMESYAWGECPYCGALEILCCADTDDFPCGCLAKRQKLFNAISEGLPKETSYEYTSDEIETWYHDRIVRLMVTSDTPRLVAAYTAARQARFEHGEKGGTR